MSRMAGVYQEHQDRENESGLYDHEAWVFHNEQKKEREFIEHNEGCYQCPYCGSITTELSLCCGELHGEKIEAKSDAVIENTARIMKEFDKLFTQMRSK